MYIFLVFENINVTLHSVDNKMMLITLDRTPDFMNVIKQHFEKTTLAPQHRLRFAFLRARPMSGRVTRGNVCCNLQCNSELRSVNKSNMM